jgi:hypothetical protein
MLPICSTAEAIAKYTGGYIAKHMQHRRACDKGVRLVRYGKGMLWARSRLAFNSPRCWLWRRKLEQFAYQQGCGSLDALKKKFGPRWAYSCAPAIEAMPLPVLLGEEVIDAGKYDGATAQELCAKLPVASGRRLRTEPRLRYLNPEAQALHDWKVQVIAMARSVFGQSLRVVDASASEAKEVPP